MQIALLVFFAGLMNMYENCGVCEGGAIRALTYYLSNGAKKVYEAYIAHGMSTYSHV